MPEQLLPLFPLPLVLFPRLPLPLHIFEERYKEMIGQAIDAQSEFGIVLARDNGVVNTGCTASVEQVMQRYADGRMDVLTRGRRRFEISDLVEGKAYLRGRIHYFDDEQFDPTPPEVRRRALEGYAAAVRASGGEEPEPKWTDPQLSFQLAQVLTDLDFRQQMLTLRSERDRMAKLADFFPNYISRLLHAEHVREVAPRNGFGKIHDD
jgi:Lon protease-like protein